MKGINLNFIGYRNLTELSGNTKTRNGTGFSGRKENIYNTILIITKQIRKINKNEFNEIYKPRNNLVNNDNSDLLAGSHTILNVWKTHFSQLVRKYN
jgi:hypothetical protein